MGALHVVLTAVLCCGGTPGRLTLALHTAGAQNSSYYATGGSGFMLMSNYTTDAISVATVGAMCYNGAPGYPVVEATISSIHQVSHPTALAAHRCCHALQHDTSHCCGRTIQHVLQSGVRKPHRVLPRPLLESHVCGDSNCFTAPMSRLFHRTASHDVLESRLAFACSGAGHLASCCQSYRLYTAWHCIWAYQCWHV